MGRWKSRTIKLGWIEIFLFSPKVTNIDKRTPNPPLGKKTLMPLIGLSTQMGPQKVKLDDSQKAQVTLSKDVKDFINCECSSPGLPACMRRLTPAGHRFAVPSPANSMKTLQVKASTWQCVSDYDSCKRNMLNGSVANCICHMIPKGFV